MDSNALDRHITGNWGEDSVGEEFVLARKLGDMDPGTRIDVAGDKGEDQIVATIEKISITSGFVYVTAKEFDCALVFPEDAKVYFAVA